MDKPIQVDLGRIAQDLQIRRVQVESVVSLLDDGNTVPFITRYRKERTGDLNEVTIREIQLRVQRLRELGERKETILKAIEAQGKLTPDLEAAIRAAENPKRLEDLYLPFKPRKRTKASEARDRGLEPLAFRIWTRDETLVDLSAAAAELVDAEKGVATVEAVMEGVGHILAEAISEMAAVRDSVRKVVWRTGRVVTTKAEIPEGQGLEYRDYFDYSEPVSQIPPHRVLAINRGDKEGPLKVRLEVSRPEVEAALFSQLPLEGHPHELMFRAAAIDALDRLILPSMEREVRRDLTEAAEKHAVDVFARNLRSLLLQPPIPKQVVLAIDPGFRTGCKVAVLDGNGNLLDHGVIYPHPPQNRRSEAKLFVKDLVGRHQVAVLAIGNGTACRETEELIAEIIAEGTQFSQGDSGAALATDSAAPAAQPAETAATADVPDTAAAPALEAVPGGGELSVPEPEMPAPAEVRQPEGRSPPDHGVAHEGSPGDAEPAEDLAGPTQQSPPADVHVNPPTSTPLGEDVVAAAPEAPVESLPPISGGAPESHSPEAEMETTASPDHSEGVPTAVLDGGSEPENRPREAEPADQVPAVAPEAESSPGPHVAEAPHVVAPAHDTALVEHPAAVPPAEQPVPLEATRTEPAEAEQPPLAAEQTPEAAEHLSGAAEQTPEAAEQPSGAAEQPLGAAEQPSGAAEQPSGAAEQPSGAAEHAAAVLTESTLAPPPLAARPSKSHGAGRSESRSRAHRPKQPPAPPAPPQPHAADALLAQLAYVVVNEAGASVYSTSQVGREELPDFDATLRSGISIGRRLLDPLSELVKIEPQNVGVGLYQHDVNPKHLKDSLDAVISSCVNFVGVDLNSASVSLLRYVSGLNQLTARRIAEYRKEHGPFSRREQLMQVEGIGPATFTQAAGFLKIPESEDPLDRTWIHPESYPAATKLLERFGFGPEVVRDKAALPDLCAKLAEANTAELARELEVGELTLRDIIEALRRPERDPREDLPKPIFKKGVLKLEDLAAGMELKGTVLNVVDFGAFVDIGLKDSGLVHISQLANRYVKNPHDVVSVGDVVTVWVMAVDQERKRVSLTMVKPGTERQRGAQGGARRGGGPGGDERERGGGRGPGHGRRGGGGGGPGPRPPRPTGSALTAPPVGAPSLAALAEAPSRRHSGGQTGGPTGPRGSGAPAISPGGGHAGAEGPPRGERRMEHGPGGGGRGGPRSFQGGQGHGHAPGSRPPRQDRGPGPRPRSRSVPPPPLSKDALAGNIPLRTFGQLKQLWEARSGEGPPESPEGRSLDPIAPETDHRLHSTSQTDVSSHPTESAPSPTPESDHQANSN
jgi:protein Tex